MAKYEYKGRSKIISRVPEQNYTKSKTIIDKCSFLIISSYPMANTKKLGCPLVNDHYGDDIMNLHLDLINLACEDPYIAIVGGYDIKRIFKHPRRNEFQIIENKLHEFTNSSEDLRIGLNAIPRGPVIVIDASFIPSLETFKLLLNDINESKVVYSIRKSNCVGINITGEGLINFFGYSYQNKTKGAYFVSLNDFDRIRKKCIGSTFNKNKFDFEILEELKMRAVEDKSKSLRLDENYDVKDK